jgi:hypothetical protein
MWVAWSFYPLKHERKEGKKEGRKEGSDVEVTLFVKGIEKIEVRTIKTNTGPGLLLF